MTPEEVIAAVVSMTVLELADLVKAMDAHNITSAERGDFINGTLKRRVRGWNGLTQTDLNSLMNAVNRM